MKEQIRYNVKMGIIHKWWKYACVAILITIIGIMEARQAAECVEKNIYAQPSLANYLVQWMKGIKPIERSTDTRQVQIPSEWLVLQISYLIFVAGYAAMDLKKNSAHILLRSRRKITWWHGKCIWLFLSTILYYVLFYGIVIGFAGVTGSLTLKPTSEIWIGEMTDIVNRECLIQIFLLPVLISATVGMVQMLLELLISPVVSIVIMSGYMLASLYWTSPFLLGNYTMLYRNCYFIGEKGVAVQNGVVSCIVIMIFTGIAARSYIKRMEV